MRIIGIDDAERREQVARELARIGAEAEPGERGQAEIEAGPEKRGRNETGAESGAGPGTRDRRPFTVLMYHRPDGIEDAARAGVDLMLCGHTHNGQIVPFNWIVKRQFPRIAGRFDVGGMVLYVSPGTGTWGPTMRLGSANEITVFELSPAPSMDPRSPQ